MSHCSLLASVPGRALGEALSCAVGCCLVEPWLQGNSWGWASGPCWAMALWDTVLESYPQEGEQGGDYDIWWPEVRLWLPSALWGSVTCAATVRFLIDLSYTFTQKSFGNFYSAKSWLSGKRYTFVNKKLIPLIQEKCKSTDKPSSDKKKKVREAGVLSGCSDLQNQPSGLMCRKPCRTDKDPLIGVGKHVL